MMRWITCAALPLLVVACTTQRGMDNRVGTQSLSDCVPLESIPAPRKHTAGPVRRVFIDLDSSFDWVPFIQRHEVDEVVIQALVGYDTTGARHPKLAEARELIDSVPDNVKVYVGLVYQDNFHSDTASQTTLRSAAVEDSVMADSIWNRVPPTNRSRIAGWYIAREIHNFQKATPAEQRIQQDLIRGYLARVSAALPGPGRVLISPFFVPPVEARHDDLLGIDSTAALFAELVRGTHVTDLLLQDGTSVRLDDRGQGCSWPLDGYLAVAAAYASAIKEALPGTVTFWSNVEAFGDEANRRRVRNQISHTPAGSPVIVFAYRGCQRTGVCERRRTR